MPRKKKWGCSEKMDIYFCPFLKTWALNFNYLCEFLVMQSYAAKPHLFLLIKTNNFKRGTFWVGTF
jgi:hypothetical protein